MITLSSLLIEGRYDSLVNRLTKQLIGIVKDSHEAVGDSDGMFLGNKVYYTRNESVPDINSNQAPDVYTNEIENEEIPLEFYLTLKLQWIEGFGKLDVDGNAYNDSGRDSDEPPLVEVLVKMDPEHYPQDLSKLVAELADTLRHELEHLTQSGWNTKSSKYISSDRRLRNKIETGQLPPYKYYTLPKEIPAMIHGLYNKAKKSRRPFAEVVDEHLNHVIDRGLITPEQAESIKAVWRTYLPKLAIRQDL
jgi:hypothetical protein